MNPYERMAALTALKKLVDEEAKAARAEADELLLSDEGVVKRSLMIGGTEVGEFIATKTKAQFVITDHAAFADFAVSNHFGHYMDAIKPECLDAVMDMVREQMPDAIEHKAIIDEGWDKFLDNVGDLVTYFETGEIVPGVEYIPAHLSGKTQVRGLKPWKQMVPLLGGDTSALLLGGGR